MRSRAAESSWPRHRPWWHSRRAKAGGTRAKAAGADDLVARMMAFDENKDGKLTRTEVTDERLHRLFDRADTDRTGRSHGAS